MLSTPPSEHGPTSSDRLRLVEHWCLVVSWLCQNYVGEYRAGDLRTRLAVYHAIGLIADASRGLGDTRVQMPSIDWVGLLGMRTFLVHRPWAVNGDTVWSAATESVPELLAEVRRLIAWQGR